MLSVNKPVHKFALTAVLLSLALVLSLLENYLLSLVSLTIPGIRLGVANLCVLTALYLMGFFPALTICILKSMLTGIFSGALTSILFSLMGGILSLLVMYLVKTFGQKWFSIVGVSIFGACMHNVGQICAAILLTATPQFISYLPILLIAGVVTGILIGLICQGVISRLGAIAKPTPS